MEDILGRSVDVLHAPLPQNTLIEIDKKVPVYEA